MAQQEPVEISKLKSEANIRQSANHESESYALTTGDACNNPANKTAQELYLNILGTIRINAADAATWNQSILRTLLDVIKKRIVASAAPSEPAQQQQEQRARTAP